MPPGSRWQALDVRRLDTREKQNKPLSMYLVIAMSLAVIYAALKPLARGLYDTSMWVAKTLAPPESENNDTTKQFLRMGQAALMDGWLSNIPFASSILFFSSILAGFLYHWWGGILMYLVAGILGALTDLLFTRSVSYYLPFLYHKMLNRAVDYKARNDLERAEAADSYCKDLGELMDIYQHSRRRPPTEKQLQEIPYGDPYYWFLSESPDA